MEKNELLTRIKNIVSNIEPDAKIILYGSFARGDNKKHSDIDLLILLDKEKISHQEKKKIKYPLYDLEFDTGQIISPLIFSKNEWNAKHFVTPLYNNIKHEGIEL